MIGDRITSGRSWSGRERHCLFLNTRDGKFADASYAAGVDFAEDGRGLGLVDWDHDGDLDVWITARSAPRLRLLLNRSDMGRRFVALQLRGTTANRDGVGARVTVRLDHGPPVVATVRAGEGFLSQSSKVLTLGLGRANLKGVDVRWPGGATETFAGVLQGRRYLLTQATGKAEVIPPRAATVLRPTAMKVAATDAPSATFLLRPVPFPPVRFVDFSQRQQTLTTHAGRATLVVLWSRWCKPCLAELAELGVAAAELRRRGVDVVTLNVDRLSTTRVGQALDVGDAALSLILASTGAPGLHGALDDRNMAQIEMLTRWLFTWRQPMPLPSSFLVDGDARVRAIYRGRLALPRLFADVQVLSQGRAARTAHAAVGPGFFHAPPLPADYFRLATHYLEHGHEDAALRYFVADTQQDPSSGSGFNMVGALLAKRGRLPEARKQFEKAVAAKPTHVEALRNLARIVLEAGEVVSGLGYLSRAVDVEPNSAQSRFEFGVALLRAGRLPEARTQLVKAKELDPQAPVAGPLGAIAAAEAAAAR